MTNDKTKRLAACAMTAMVFLLACSRGGPATAASKPGTRTAASEEKPDNRLTRHARLLAGIDDPATTNDPLRATEAFREHSREMSALWKSYSANEATSIRPWVQQNLASLDHAETLVYTFAGADFLFAHAFFPQVHTYVLVGLERVGTLEDLDAESPKVVQTVYADVRKTVAPLLRATYFRTLEMQEDSFREGLVPILATLIAGTHHRLVDVRIIGLTTDGRVVERTGNDAHLISGAQINFVDEGGDDVRTLYYFRADLSDKGLAKQGGLLPFIDKLPSKVALAKAAAYCMHTPQFSVIRNELLRNCDAVLEDDTGIPLKNFNATSWDVRFYGNYTQPIGMFKNYRQADLAQAYAAGQNILPLPFRVGYGDTMASNLLLATKRTGPGTDVASHERQAPQPQGKRIR